MSIKTATQVSVAIWKLFSYKCGNVNKKTGLVAYLPADPTLQIKDLHVVTMVLVKTDFFHFRYHVLDYIQLVEVITTNLCVKIWSFIFSIFIAGQHRVNILHLDNTPSW